MKSNLPISYFTSSFNSSYVESFLKVIGNPPDFSIVHDSSEQTTSPSQIDILNARTGHFELSNIGLELLPLSKEDYQYFSEYIEPALLMFDRQDPKQLIQTSSRIALFWQFVQFWKTLFLKRKPSYLISRNIPHFPSEYVLYLTFQRYNTPFFMMDYCEHIERMQLITSIEQRTIPLPKNFSKLEPHSLIGAQKIIDKIKDERYSGVNSFYKNIYHLAEESFFYRLKVRFRLLAYSFYFPLRRIQSALILSTRLNARPYRYQVGLHFFINTFIIHKLYNYYKKVSGVSSERISEKKILFFPLHYQPERTSLPDAVPFQNQLRVIDILSRSVPHNWEILVKEHPTTFRFPYKVFLRGNYNRSRAFYNQILTYPNVHLVPLQDSTQEWIKKADVISTLNGSVTLEALCSSKKVVLFGNSWFKSFPNTLSYRNSETLKDFLLQKDRSSSLEIEDRIKNVLAHYHEHTVNHLLFNQQNESKMIEETEVYVNQIALYFSKVQPTSDK